MGAKKISEAVTEAELIEEVSRVISNITGVVLGKKQYALVQGRLAKRMRDLKIASHADYARHLNANTDVEIGVLTSLLTTHHTYFFREFQHFEFLLNNTLPSIVRHHRKKGIKTIRIWSAACSRGQEVYSLAMFLRHHLPMIAPDMSFEIVGTDICEESITIAKNGVYTWEELRVAPTAYLQGHWTRGTGKISEFVRAKEELRERVEFKILNLQELARAPFGPNAPKFDAIFCRNVFIYFTHGQIKTISRQMVEMLSPVGQLFLGLSETLSGMGLPVEWVGPSVYVNKDVLPANNVLPIRPEIRPPAPMVKRGVAPTPVLRVLCVDDSSTILTLLKRIIGGDKGFEIVGTAANGVEAYEQAKALKPDLITLDIHMPRMSGVEFLEKHHRELKIPTVIVSSVPREDSELAFRCLELGASDYIEKPTLQNMDKVEEELRFKLKVAHQAKKSEAKKPKDLALDESFKRAPYIGYPEGKLRVIFAHFAARDSLKDLLAAFKAPQPPTLVLVEGAGELHDEWAKKMAARCVGGTVQMPSGELNSLAINTVTFLDFDKGIDLLQGRAKDPTKPLISSLALGPMSPKMLKALPGLPATCLRHLIVEDRGVETPDEIVAYAKLVVPVASFVYESDRYFATASEKGEKK